jgi:hypothetical protein
VEFTRLRAEALGNRSINPFDHDSIAYLFSEGRGDGRAHISTRGLPSVQKPEHYVR